jgi:hypothetical protein
MPCTSRVKRDFALLAFLREKKACNALNASLSLGRSGKERQ